MVKYLIFQFHKGTIKTEQRISWSNRLNYFNSIKVRLKPNKESVGQTD